MDLEIWQWKGLDISEIPEDQMLQEQRVVIDRARSFVALQGGLSDQHIEDSWMYWG